MSSPGGHLLQSRDPAKAGAALTIANDAGADEVSGPSFSLEDQHTAKARPSVKPSKMPAPAGDAAQEMGCQSHRYRVGRRGGRIASHERLRRGRAGGGPSGSH